MLPTVSVFGRWLRIRHHFRPYGMFHGRRSGRWDCLGGMVAAVGGVHSDMNTVLKCFGTVGCRLCHVCHLQLQVADVTQGSPQVWWTCKTSLQYVVLPCRTPFVSFWTPVLSWRHVTKGVRHVCVLLWVTERSGEGMYCLHQLHCILHQSQSLHVVGFCPSL